MDVFYTANCIMWMTKKELSHLTYDTVCSLELCTYDAKVEWFWHSSLDLIGSYVVVLTNQASVTILTDFDPEFNSPFRWRS